MQVPFFVQTNRFCFVTDLQAQDERRLPDLQTADRPVLLPRQALHGDQVPSAVLLQYQVQAQAAAAATADTAGGAAAAPCGCDEQDHAAGECSLRGQRAVAAAVPADRRAWCCQSCDHGRRTVGWVWHGIDVAASA